MKDLPAPARDTVGMTTAQNAGKTALVIGCGIGGPVAAMALQKVGIDATVFEAYDGNAEFVGSFLNTASTAWMRSRRLTRTTECSHAASRRRAW